MGGREHPYKATVREAGKELFLLGGPNPVRSVWPDDFVNPL